MKREPLPEIARDQVDAVVDALWSEIDYINKLDRRTADEAKDIPAFITLMRVLLDDAARAWMLNPGTEQPDGSVQVAAAQDAMRKVVASGLRCLIVNGVRERA